ncbi:hypothetical protein [Embleya sp. NPDC020886]
MHRWGIDIRYAAPMLRDIASAGLHRHVVLATERVKVPEDQHAVLAEA